MSTSSYICPGCDTVVIQIGGRARHLNPETECKYNHEKLLKDNASRWIGGKYVPKLKEVA